jgi:gas vesicle protein
MRRSKVMKKFLSFMSGVIMGGLVGATIALLLAPFSGETLRGQIRERITARQFTPTKIYLGNPGRVNSRSKPLEDFQ